MENVFVRYEKALSILEAHKSHFPIEIRKLEDSKGAYLAEDLVADRDFPPFDRVTMDGIAIAFDRFEEGQREYVIESTAPAGAPQKSLQNPKKCIEVMTGAIMPKGVDTVIRYEDLNISDGKVIIQLDVLQRKQNLHFQGIDISKQKTIVPKGIRLSSAEISIAAAVGKDSLKVRKMPKVVIVSTGDELVPVHATPKLHQIRRSNVYGIQATLQEWGIFADLQHLPDNKAVMEVMISDFLAKYDLLIFTGGVSQGKFDYLPEVLQSLHIQKHFHKIQQRPGKPFWFGTNEVGKKIFALPGNPVSSCVCVYVYFQFWLNKSLGIEPPKLYVTLNNDVEFKPDLIYFLEASLYSTTDGTLVADPVKGNGSGDFANLVKTDGFLVLPQNKSKFFKGEVYPFVSYRSKFH